MSGFKKTYYIVSHTSDYDDDIFKYSCLYLIAESKPKAWKKFVALVGKDKNYWRKLDYRAQPVTVTLKIER